MKKQLNLFLLALSFYSQIPVKRSLDYSEENMNKSTRFFPLIGLIIGGVGAFVFWGTSFIFPVYLSAILAIGATVLTTGAFHEDGFTDFCDGFGGGYTPEKIIAIMKDSRIGTYGACGLLFMTLIRIGCISSIDTQFIPLVLITAHGFSRVMPVLVIFSTNYVRDDVTSKIKPIGKKGSTGDLITAIIFGSIGLLFFPWKFIPIIILVLLLITFIFRRYIIRKIGGYTGDCLGALQHICEVVFYLGFLVFIKIIG